MQNDVNNAIGKIKNTHSQYMNLLRKPKPMSLPPKYQYLENYTEESGSKQSDSNKKAAELSVPV